MKNEKIISELEKMKQLLNEAVVSKFITSSELAKRWKMCERTLRRWREDGLGPAFVTIKQRNGRSVIRYPLHNPTPNMKGVLCIELESFEQLKKEI